MIWHVPTPLLHMDMIAFIDDAGAGEALAKFGL